MLETLRQNLATGLQHLSVRLQRAGTIERLPHHECPVLIFFHGYSLAHTIRPLVVGRALRARGYPVEFAGVGPHAARIAAEGFQVYAVETMPQSRMDEYVARGDYGYYNAEWIDRCVQAERALIRQLCPALALADMRPTLPLTASLEGVDIALIEAAYNQPDYPFPIRLPPSFSLGTESFDEYSRNHISTFKPHHILYLVADVPQFHPPGEQTPSHYCYVGPLIESPRPRPISVLDDWDEQLPLIYFNCGSTGAHPGFLDEALRRMANKPYRVLVTTAGRWAGQVAAPNIRVVDFVPAAWVLARAALFIGIGGIGSIYHALRQGVPVIGAPEHLDQEYHLNRVRDLGLGCKLNWDEFLQVDPLLEAIDDLLARSGEFAPRCQALAAHIGEWNGGEAAADALDAFFVGQHSAHQIGTAYLIPEPEFVHSLNLSTPADLDVEAIRTLLHRNLSRGLPHTREGSRIAFDRAASWNWLYDHEPAFFESDYRALEERRRHFFQHANGHIALHRDRQRYRLTYTYRLYPPTLPPDTKAQLFLPYPIPSPHQGDIELHACAPDDLRTCFAPQAGFFYGYPVQVEEVAPASVDFSYTCELTVQGRKGPTVSSPLSACEYRRYSEIDPKLAQEAVVKNFFAELGLDEVEDPLEKARRMYAQLAGVKRFKKTKERSQDLASSIHVVLNDSGGHCITLSNAFIALCRLQGIAARQVTGALAGYPAGDGRFEIAAYNEILFGHTWVEIFAPGQGWVPVEFHGIVIGPQAATEDNVADEALRRHIAEVSGRYVDFYFGQLDCHRVVCSNSVKTIPQLLAWRETAAGPQFHMPEGLKYECRLVFECI
ncbi:MAG: glycosyltransferase [Gemmatimonadetes bacterium]|nr:glycosyltransferase [Gemmatimonadota bacterium]